MTDQARAATQSPGKYGVGRAWLVLDVSAQSATTTQPPRERRKRKKKNRYSRCNTIGIAPSREHPTINSGTSPHPQGVGDPGPCLGPTEGSTFSVSSDTRAPEGF